MTQSHNSRREAGRRGEEAAASFLVEQGYAILQRNWRCRSGELDIIAEEQGTLVFVEVRSRRQGGAFGTPEESVDWRKQKKVRETAQVYLHLTRQWERSVRFDLVAVRTGSDGEIAGMTLLRHAF
ncbi:UPF0102 protein [Paenibacillus sp. J31TS4]|uniref:YraN family protein n=1 Tax=Paenibacillus sp. J31TS4 TaxID=2807195 RepID=UPI001B245D98|nr:YraN family protein [Paenibacillus sp. J31TS4]GIP36793.1 UPF0102 protein [Paenibacillus sp. J31TS4]